MEVRDADGMNRACRNANKDKLALRILTDQISSPSQRTKWHSDFVPCRHLAACARRSIREYSRVILSPSIMPDLDQNDSFGRRSQVSGLRSQVSGLRSQVQVSENGCCLAVSGLAT
jgi:hypothetical protein